MKKHDFGRYLDNRRLMMLFSVVLAVISWLVIAYAVDTSSYKYIEDVPVDVSAQQAETLDLIGLKIVEGDTARVKVRISGERYIIGSVEAADISVVANLSGITSAGSYNRVQMTGTDKYGKGFEVTQIAPEFITLKVDRPKTKKFAITADIEGLVIPEEYLGSDPVISPREVTIVGPEADVSRIDKCVVSAKFTEPLTSSVTKKSEILLYDVEGNLLSKELLTLNSDTADITVPVLKQKTVPLNFGFNRIPSGFPYENIDYEFMDRGSIRVAGPEAAIDAYSEVPLGYVNINEIHSGGFVQTFDVSLPAGFQNVDNIKQVDVLFHTQDMTEATFKVTNIRAINVPANYTVTVTTTQITDVTIVGDPEVMKTLSPEDLIAEIDLSGREVTPGPYNLEARISIPGKKLAWATGQYTAVVAIKEQ